MAKHKKKKSKKSDASDDVLDTAALSIKKFRKVTNQLSKLSTGQKLAGGLALVAAGLIYLDQRKSAGSGSGFDWRRLVEANEANEGKETYAAEADTEDTPPPLPVTGKHHRPAKPKKARAHHAKKPTSTDDV